MKEKSSAGISLFLLESTMGAATNSTYAFTTNALWRVLGSNLDILEQKLSTGVLPHHSPHSSPRK